MLSAKSFAHSVRIAGKLAFGALACTVLFMSSCTNGKKTPDVSAVKVQLQSYRFDRDIAAIDTNHVGAGLQQLAAKYPDFINFYLDTLMAFGIHGDYSDTFHAVQQGIRMGLTNSDYRNLFDTVAAHFPDTKNIDKELTSGFQYMKYYYPKYEVPKIIYLISWLNKWGAFTYNGTTIGVGLDMFLGGSYPYYKSVGIPEYASRKLTPSRIPVAVFSAIYLDEHPDNPDRSTLLDILIHRGKQQYFLKSILPNAPDSLLLGFSGKEVIWCEENEAQIYNFFVQEQLLYEKDLQKISPYINDGPDIPSMKGAPGNIGIWVGLRIVEAYMKEHPQTTMPQLLAQDNIESQNFLSQSRYKPR